MAIESTAAQAMDGAIATKRQRHVSWTEVRQRLNRYDKPHTHIYGVPRGGLCASALLRHASVVTDASAATLILDDLIDSGATRARYAQCYPDKPFVALYDKQRDDKHEPWLVFPWEAHEAGGGAEDAVVRLLQHIGEDPQREGLLETPRRVVKALSELTSGYSQDIAGLLSKVFSEVHDEMIVVGPIAFSSLCEHHMLPFTGHAMVGYVPDRKVVGLSKIPRVVEAIAKRLQVQERLTDQVVAAIMEHLRPLGAGCTIVASHSCMCMRGVRASGAKMTTSSLQGVLRSDAAARSEFLDMCKAALQ